MPATWSVTKFEAAGPILFLPDGSGGLVYFGMTECLQQNAWLPPFSIQPNLSVD